MSSFDYEFDKVVYKKKKEKQQKKELFEKNIQNRIVYMDDKGNIKKKQQEPETQDDKITMFVGIFILLIIMALLKR